MSAKEKEKENDQNDNENMELNNNTVKTNRPMVRQNIDDITEVLEIIGRKRGCLMKGNIVDIDKVYTIIINDLKEGKTGKVTFDR